MTTLNLNGPVVGNDSSWIYDFLGIDCINPGKVQEALSDADDSVVINLSSGGGEVTAASEIYTALRQADQDVAINITGMAASAASVIAMAGDTVNISPTAQFMIHQASVANTNGNKDDLSHLADILDVTDQSIAQAYVDRTSLDLSTIVQMMADETFLTAKQAVDYGFVDNIMFASEGQQVTNSVESGLLSTNVINKVGTLIAMQKQAKPQAETQSNTETDSRQALRNAKAAILLED